MITVRFKNDLPGVDTESDGALDQLLGFVSGDVQASYDGAAYIHIVDPATGAKAIVFGNYSFDTQGNLSPASTITGMTFFNAAGTGILFIDGLPAVPIATLLEADDVELSRLYEGQGLAIHGTTGNDVLGGDIGPDVLYGYAGDDVLYAGAGDTVIGDTGVDTVRASVSWTLADDLENLELLGEAASGTGNAQTNFITGNADANTLAGLDGDDRVRGGGGDDAVSGGQGRDTLYGDDGNDVIDGGNNDDLLIGGAGNDHLDGGPGYDVLAGGPGDDTYVTDGAIAPSFSLTVSGDPGDPVSGGSSYALTSDTGTFTVVSAYDANGDGGLDRISIAYSPTSSSIQTWTLRFEGPLVTPLSEATYTTTQRLSTFGAAGLDISSSYGGPLVTASGTFTIHHLAATPNLPGNTFYIDSFSASFEQHSDGAAAAVRGILNYNYTSGVPETITESPQEGTDTVQTATTYTLPSNVENLTLTGTADIDGTGNALNNVLRGNSGNNTLTGGLGDDTYVVQGVGDVIVEGSNAGNDTIVAPFSYSVVGTNVENVTLSGTSDIDATGDAGNNVLVGNAGINVLTGGAGDDTYEIQNAGDSVVELAGEGNDTVRTSLSYDVAGTNVENVTLIGTGLVDATGDALANVLRGNGAANLLRGLGGNDTLNGDAGNDTLSGGAGDDTLNGGIGRDVAVYGGARGDYTVTRAGGTVTVTSAAEGTDTLASVERIDFGDGSFIKLGGGAGSDFDGDGRMDMLWRNVDGTPAIWQMDGLSTGPIGPINGGVVVPNDWKILGTGDYDADGRTDILWRNDDGMPAIWLMDGMTTLSANPVNGGVVVPNEWKFAANADFNADGYTDILWRNDDGMPAIWQMDGVNTRVANPINGGVAVPNDWKIAGTGDFNGDGNADILWRNDDGTPAIWTMDGVNTLAANVINGGVRVPNDWKVAGVGDFDGDAKSDILWRNVDGTPSIWLMDGYSTATANVINGGAVVPNAWKVINVADYNGDGRDDILWRHDDGTPAMWLMNGMTTDAADAINGGTQVPNDWVIA